MPGAVIIVVALLLFPVLALMGLSVVAAGLGSLLNRDAVERNEGSELVDVNY